MDNMQEMDGAILSKAKELAKDLLIQSEERIKLILEHLAAGVVIIDSTGLIQAVNPAFERLVQQNSENLVGSEIGEVLVSQNSNSSLFTRLRECCGGGIFTTHVRSTGFDLVPVELAATMLQTKMGDAIMLCILDASLGHHRIL